MTIAPTTPHRYTSAEFEHAVLSQSPAVAVFDCDGTLWSGDAGCGFMTWSIDQGLVSRNASDWIDAQYRLYLAGEVSEEQMCGEMVQLYADLREDEIRHASATVINHTEGRARALPLIEDGAVPLDKMEEFLNGIYGILMRNHLQAAVWGHAGDANFHVQPYLDVAQLGDRQIAFRIMDEYYKLVTGLGGTLSGQHGDGRLRGAYLPKMYGEEGYGLLEKVKKIFDPYGTMNPGVKIGVTIDGIKPLLRQEYSLGHLHQHLPRN